MKLGFVAAGLAALLLGACATPPKSAPAAATSLLGKTNWTAVKLNGADVPVGATISLDFGDSKIAGTAGCNRYFGAYRESQPKLSVSGVGSTKMACAAPVMAREEAFLSTLGAASTFAYDASGALIITASDGRTITLLPAGS